MNYDTMSVMSLLCAYAEWAMCEEFDKRIGEEFVIIESALRRKVIEEASVKTVEVSGDESKEWLHIEGGILPDGIYDLIPKETT